MRHTGFYREQKSRAWLAPLEFFPTLALVSWTGLFSRVGNVTLGIAGQAERKKALIRDSDQGPLSPLRIE